MKLLLSDNQLHLRFAPLTLTRPLAELRCGLFTNSERWKHLLPGAQIGYQTESYLQAKYPSNDGIWVNAQCIPNQEMVAALCQLKEGQALYSNQILIACFREEQERIDIDLEDLLLLENRWDLYLKNDAILRLDFNWYCAGRTSAALSQSNRLIGPADQLFIEEGARVEGAILNTNEGPIYIGKNAEVMEGALLRGPLALCDGAVVKMGAKIYGATSIGPECRVGGEVSNSIFQGYSNKGHDGFLGNALIGEWCNLGADTNCSNLKNNYGKVSTYSYEAQDHIKTDQLFMGLTMGDHSKSAINVQFNTASVVGVCSNVFCSHFPEKHIASFEWVSDASSEKYRLDKAIEAASAMMARRKVAFSPEERQIFEFLANN
ncbi:MAG: GlmU family protein [Crocinitomicaceae bacterium]|jgi:UDP-N-acetylglucosamine diphosphorylase/glucosamine-1-phosphate N-acetyltransferase|nr:GlmU family protein [Crocinitomicaceae bacterium]MDP4738682.1 GlmU family protein [Crocinitomicaceae bacterium]MDP4806078.1 GlmU family protein [Crocinitomicaceae bacterium]MDP5042175.1 GlmU family protein [Crocinitomicaceae bacterium]MDP5066939.1 GlmU family protein [Crocinitomicaceae bacterium]